MKLLVITLLYFFNFNSVQTCDLTIEVDNLRVAKGQILIAIFNSEDGYPEDIEKAVDYFAIPVNKIPVTSYTMKNLPPGDYAFTYAHDENMNGKMDYNWIGMPKEGFGFSNNPRVIMSVPKFKTVKVSISKPKEKIRIQTIYF